MRLQQEVAATSGLIAKQFGPAIGGLFLAFPATATLIESHEKRKNREAGLDGTRRGRKAAGIDAAIVAIGLIALAVVLRLTLAIAPTWLSLGLATLTWAVLSFAGWNLWRRRFVKTLLAKMKHSRPANA